MTGPSFMAYLRDEIAKHTPGHPVFELTGKTDGRDFAARVGVRVPQLLAGPFGISDWPLEVPGSAVVIKPTRGCNSRGVVPLLRDERDSLRSAWGDGTKHWHEWCAWSVQEWWRHRKLDRAPYEPRWIVEELVGGAVPFDWKFHCIHGRVGWVRQFIKTGRKSHEARALAWDATDPARWVPFPEDAITSSSKSIDPELPPPRHPAILVEAAEDLARAFLDRTGCPFVRVDLFEDENGPVFCEFTPHPAGGRQVYRPEWDLKLGRVWADGR